MVRLLIALMLGSWPGVALCDELRVESCDAIVFVSTPGQRDQVEFWRKGRLLTTRQHWPSEMLLTQDGEHFVLTWRENGAASGGPWRRIEALQLLTVVRPPDESDWWHASKPTIGLKR